MNSAGPTAIHERHRAGGRRPSTAAIACPNGGIYQSVEVEYDGDQGYAAPRWRYSRDLPRSNVVDVESASFHKLTGAE